MGEVEVLYFASPFFTDEFTSILLRDMLLALVAVAFVFFCLWAHSGSLFLATAGMMEILLTIPVAFVLYRVVFGFQYFAGLNAMTLFVVLAIGADDIFVLMDAYQQSLYHGPVCKDLKTRMTWVYRRATSAMFVTSFTTMAAFVASATSPLVDVQSFGIFAACTTLVDFAAAFLQAHPQSVLPPLGKSIRDHNLCSRSARWKNFLVDPLLNSWLNAV